MDIIFYCQNCNHPISANDFGSLYSGRCPKCESMEGFSTISKDAIDPFVGATMITDSQILNNGDENQ